MAKKVASLTESLMPVEAQAAIPPRIAKSDSGDRGRPRSTVKMTTFNLRLPADVVASIDTDRGHLYSRNAWIAMAIGEKLKTR
jgi:hypothetical protein